MSASIRIPALAIGLVLLTAISASGSTMQDFDLPDLIGPPLVLDGGGISIGGCDNGFIGICELNLVLSNWNMTAPPAHPEADYSGDGFIGIEDLNVVLSNWNAVTPPTDSATTGSDLGDCFPEDPGCGGGGFIGIADLNRVLANWNQTVPPADPVADHHKDGFIGIEDLNWVLANWNNGTPPTAVVPEPAAVVLLSIGLLSVFRKRRS